MKTYLEIDPKETEKMTAQDYVAPQIVLELDLETRAGSVLPSSVDPLDLVGLGSETDHLP